MRIEIPTNGRRITDPDIRAIYSLDYALRISTDKGLKANLEWAISKYNDSLKKKKKVGLK